MRRWFGSICSFLLVFSCVMLAGCVSSEQFYEDVSLSREAAYRQWKHRKERQEQAQTHISGKLSIEDCLKLAMVNNKVLQRIIQEKEVARRTVEIVFSNIAQCGSYG